MTRQTGADSELGRIAAGVVRVSEKSTASSTREVDGGGLRGAIRTGFLDDVAGAMLESEPVEVTRAAVGTTVASDPLVKAEGIVPITPVLEDSSWKKLLLTEELHIRRRTSGDVVETPMTLRRQRVVVERYDAGHLLNEEDYR